MEGAGLLTASLRCCLRRSSGGRRAHKSCVCSRRTNCTSAAQRNRSASWRCWRGASGFLARGISASRSRPVLLHPSENWLPVVLLAAPLLYGLASFIAGASQCWGMRSDPHVAVLGLRQARRAAWPGCGFCGSRISTWRAPSMPRREWRRCGCCWWPRRSGARSSGPRGSSC